MLRKREVPQEHSHRNVLLAVNEALQLDNPDNIQDPVFGLLGAAAAAEGAGNIADADCLQQATADQAFTNAKAAGDVNGMTFALIYRALERNTGSVGLESVPCESIQAVNPEIAALQQHQDPAADGAAELNKQIATELAAQIAAIGGDPALANEASTFAPGEIGDPTGAGNTCNDDQDDAGCINSQNLRVDDLSEEEILAAAGGAGAAADAGADAGAANQGLNATENVNAGAGAGQNVGDAVNNNNNANLAADLLGNAGQSSSRINLGNILANLGIGQNSNNNRLQLGQGISGLNVVGRQAGGGAGAFGTCADPTIVFGPTSDGRQEDAFEPSDLATFNHGSANNINIISSFICSQLSNACDADAAAVATCESAAQAADGLEGDAAAQAFNSGLGL
ncbi:hypothetical protein BS50DRAFT_639210 [Corynespora cassiicola Philippines]|uniref:Uncharacterized protein n=1 Tax=Corynespora cassiicola Philippines TaxID=1448308 RepID=A0A2T2N7J6_CORCC|nr:hypothetical protein BS50DRAFT_639210 [Corynespora cassiicola Philippines]